MELCAETKKMNRLFEDVYDGKIPERVPMFIQNDDAFAVEYAGYDLRVEQYSTDKVIEAIDKVTADFDVDTIGASYARLLHFYRILGAKNFVQGADGFLQHPEIHTIESDEYDDLIADPFKTIYEKTLPRAYTALEGGGFAAQKALAQAFFTFYASMGKIGAALTAIANKYGKSTYNFASSAACCTPFDMLAGHLRSFTGLSSDLRRRPQKVIDACEALLPLAIKSASPPEANRYNRAFIPCHMAPFMRESDFKKAYWPTFKAYIEALDAKGISCNIFVEQDWTRYLDYLYELPERTCLYFEYGDPRIIKEKLGKKFVICGLFPVQYLKNATAQEAIDKGKEFYDIMAPGGNFILGLDKAFLRLSDCNVEVTKAFLTAMREYGKY